MRIQDIMQGKSATVATIGPSATVRETVSALAQHNVGALIVSSDGTSVIGIVSERDVVRRLNGDADVLDGPVSAIMTESVRTCVPGQQVDEIMKQMTEFRIRHVPVVVDGALVGIVSIGDLVKSRIGELEFERDQLSQYVAG